MKFYIYTASLLAMVAASNIVLAHGSGGGTSTDGKDVPTIKFNITPTHSEPPAWQEPPNLSLLIEGKTIHLSLTRQDGTPIDAESASAKAYIIVGKKISTTNLWPESGNVLSGKGDFVSEPSMRVEIKLHLPGRDPIRKDFYPFQ